MSTQEAIRLANRSMIGFDLALGSGALLAPAPTLQALGHDEPSSDARHLFRRCGPIWLTFAGAHAVADRRGAPEDWWALAWLRATELATDVLWSRSPAFSRPGARAALWLAGAGNLAMTLGFGWMARERKAADGPVLIARRYLHVRRRSRRKGFRRLLGRL